MECPGVVSDGVMDTTQSVNVFALVRRPGLGRVGKSVPVSYDVGEEGKLSAVSLAEGHRVEKNGREN